MIRRKLIAAMSMIVVGSAPALAGGDGSYQSRDKKSSFYAGGVVGYGWGRLSGGGDKHKTDGVMGGGVVGYRVFSGNGSVAIEGDILGSNIKRDEVDQETYSNGDSYRFNARFGTDILASLRVKGSWGQGDFRPYLTGGLAWQRFELKYNDEDTINGRVDRKSGSINDNQYGFTLGAGVDWQASSSYSVSLGYHYYRFKSGLIDELEGTDLTTNLHTIRLGGKLHY